MSAAGRRWPALALAALVAVACLWRFDRAGDQLAASLTLARVQGETQAMLATGRIYPQILRDWTGRLRAAREADPAEAALPLAEGSLHLLARRPEAAAKAYRDALALEPRPETWLNLARAQQALGDAEGAAESYRKALLLAPHLRDEIPEEVRRAVRRARSRGT